MKRIICVMTAGFLTLSMTSISVNAEEISAETTVCVSENTKLYDETVDNILSTDEAIPSKTWGATSNGQSFSKEWEVTKDLYVRDVDDPIGAMRYGYDTDWINEDYCSCYFIDHNSRAAISRSGYPIEEGDYGNPAIWSYVEVTHKTSTVSYYAQSYGEW